MRIRCALLTLVSTFVLRCGGTEATSTADAAPDVAVKKLVCDPENGYITLSDGFCALLVADDLGRAFIVFHGSWNRAPLPRGGYKVVFVPVQDGKPSGGWEIFADDWKGVETLEEPGDRRFRPTGLAQRPGGSLYVSDSKKGRIRRIVHQGPKRT